MAWWNPIVYSASYGRGRLCGGSADTYRVTSDRSFVDIAKSKGVTNYDIFTTCSWPNVTQSVDDGSTYYLPPMADISYAQTTNTFGPTTTGHTWNGATVENRECVVEKLVNKYAESGWTLLTPPDANFASFSTNQRSYWFTRQNATSSLQTPSTSVSALTGPVDYKVVSFNSGYCEGCDRCHFDCPPVGGSNASPSNFSFVDVMKREGLTDADIFTACSYETFGNHGIGKSYETSGEQTDCVIEKFVAKLGQANWTLYSTPTNVNNVASWHFTRQNATSS